MASSDIEKATRPNTLSLVNDHTPRSDSTITSEDQHDSSDPGPPPDGGLTAWTQVAMAHIAAFNTWGYISSFGVFQTHYLQTLDYSTSEISWIGSVQPFLLLFVGAFSGRAMDAGHFRITYSAGIAFQLLGVFTTSAATTYWQLMLSQGVCTGIGSGLLFCPVTAVVATWFSKRKVFALAVLLTGAGTGGMVFPAIVQRLLPRIGFGWTMRVLGFLMLGTSLVTLAFFRTRLPPRKTGPLIDWPSFKDRPFVLYCTGMFFNFWALYFTFYYVGAFAEDRIGFTFDRSVNLLIAQNGVGIIGRLIPAYFADRYTGPVNLLVPLSVITALLYYVWASVESAVGIWIFSSLYGLFSNGVQGMWPSGLTSLTSDITKTGSRIGMGFTIVSFACLTGPPFGGALVSYDEGKYLYAQMWGGSSFLLGALILATARFAKVGKKVRKKV